MENDLTEHDPQMNKGNKEEEQSFVFVESKNKMYWWMTNTIKDSDKMTGTGKCV